MNDERERIELEIEVLEEAISVRKQALNEIPKPRPELAGGQVWREDDGTLWISSKCGSGIWLAELSDKGRTYAETRGFGNEPEIFEYVGMFDEVLQLRPGFDGGKA